MIRGLAEPPHEAGLRKALELFEAHEMRLFSATTRLRLGEVQGGDVGAANVRAASAWLQAQGVKNPEAMARVFTPAVARASPGNPDSPTTGYSRRRE